jgi:hypothetical protein
VVDPEGDRLTLGTQRSIISDAMPMKHGRIIRISEHRDYTTYIVAEENAAKAIALIRTMVGPGPVVQSIGRASLKLLEAACLSAGEFKMTENY